MTNSLKDKVRNKSRKMKNVKIDLVMATRASISRPVSSDEQVLFFLDYSFSLAIAFLAFFQKPF